MNKRLLADVLWDAANGSLWSGDETEPYDNNSSLANPFKPRREFSCDAVGQCDDGWNSPSILFVEQLGCSPFSLEQFEEFSRGTARQGVRYMWLLLAMHVAEDERLTV
jgi:hypothetical protein